MLVFSLTVLVFLGILVKPAYDTLVSTSNAETGIVTLIRNNTHTILNIIQAVEEVANDSRRLLPETVQQIKSAVALVIDHLNATESDDYPADYFGA